MTYASTIMAEVSTDLQDQSSGDEYTRWTQDMLLSYLNDAERGIVTFKPTAYVVAMVYQLVAGTRQTLPDGSASYLSPAAVTHPQAIELVKLSRNMGTDGLTAGASILPVTPQDMDEMFPAWRSATASATVVHYIFDPADRTHFGVYPPQPSSSMGWVEAIASAVPPLVVKLGESYDADINLGDEYVPAIKAHMKFSAYGVDAQNSQSAYARAADAWNLFLTLIGRKDLIESKYPARRGVNGNSNQPVPQ